MTVVTVARDHQTKIDNDIVAKESIEMKTYGKLNILIMWIQQEICASDRYLWIKGLVRRLLILMSISQIHCFVPLRQRKGVLVAFMEIGRKTLARACIQS